MAKPRVVLHLGAINALMKSAEVQDFIDSQGQAIATRAGGDYTYSRPSKQHRWVARGYVQTAGAAGARDNAKNNTLLKALGGGA